MHVVRSNAILNLGVPLRRTKEHNEGSDFRNSHVSSKSFFSTHKPRSSSHHYQLEYLLVSPSWHDLRSAIYVIPQQRSKLLHSKYLFTAYSFVN